MTTHYYHAAGQLATVTDHGYSTAGPIPFEPDQAAADGWTVIGEGEFFAHGEAITAAIQRECEEMSAHTAEYNRCYAAQLIFFGLDNGITPGLWSFAIQSPATITLEAQIF